MAEHTNSTETSSSGVIVLCLYVVAGLALATGVLIGVAYILQTPQEQRSALEMWARAAESLMFGVVAACLLCAGAWMIRQREETAFSLRRVLRILLNHHRQENGAEAGAALSSESSISASEMASASEGDLMPQLLRQLTELNANVLLTEEERKDKRRKALVKLADDLAREIESALLERRFDDADDMTQRLREIAPHHERLGVFQDQVVRGKEDMIRELISGQVQHASDLMSVSRFEEAVEVAETLHYRYPQSREADELLARVQREAATFHTEKRHRLYAVIQENSQARHWKQALAGAHKLLETYADSEEAEKIRTMMPTLVDNARIQDVREYRDKIVDLMERHRYAEAIQLAKHVVDNYPETTAAEELRAQMTKLRELAYANKNNGD